MHRYFELLIYQTNWNIFRPGRSKYDVIIQKNCFSHGISNFPVFFLAMPSVFFIFPIFIKANDLQILLMIASRIPCSNITPTTKVPTSLYQSPKIFFHHLCFHFHLKGIKKENSWPPAARCLPSMAVQGKYYLLGMTWAWNILNDIYLTF